MVFVGFGVVYVMKIESQLIVACVGYLIGLELRLQLYLSGVESEPTKFRYRCIIIEDTHLYWIFVQ